MEISFDTKELRDICRSPEVAESLLPQVVAQALRVVVANLRATRSLEQFGAIEGIVPSETFDVSLAQGFKLQLVTAHRTTPKTDGDFDPTRVYRVKVLAIAGEGR